MSDTAQNSPSTTPPQEPHRHRVRGFAARVLERIAADEVRDVVGAAFDALTGGED